MNHILISYYVFCGFLGLISVPLILGYIPPNSFYGVRITRTLNNEVLWYRANRFGGWAILISSIVGAIAVSFVAQFIPAWMDYAKLLSVLPLIVAIVVTWIYALRVTEESR